MADRQERRARAWQLTGTQEGDGVTTLELFFDLVYAFAFTQVTWLMAHGEEPGSVLDGAIVLSLLWFAWCAFTWLANQARATVGALQGAFVVAMSAVFVACLALPDAFHDVPGGLDAATIVVVAYAVVRLTHAATYLVAAGDDARLRRQVLVTITVSLVPTLTLLGIGAAVGAPGQRWVWLGAVVYDFGSVFVTATLAQGWVIHSAAHFTERHGLIVILALGESIIATGTGLEGTTLTWRVVVGALLSLLVAIGLYAAYFRRLPDLFEETLTGLHGVERARVGTDVFTYLHFLLIAGVIVTALGVEQAMGHLDAEHLGSLGGWALGVGVALFLAGTILAVVRCSGRWPVARVVVALLLAVCSPLLAQAPPLLAAALTAAALGALSVAESVRPVA